MYRRTTREVPLGAVPPAIGAALAKHAGDHQLTLDAARVRVWHTHSENPKADNFWGKLFGARANSVDPDAEHDSVLVLHPTHLLVATSGEKRGTSVLSIPLLSASIMHGSVVGMRFGVEVPGANDGITISGFPGETGRPGSYFFGLGSEAAGTECARAVEAAVSAAKNPR